jgi:hypothetical protein
MNMMNYKVCLGEKGWAHGPMAAAAASAAGAIVF